VVIDGATVLMGSWNWSNNAQRQDNSDVLFKDCPEIAAAFEKNYKTIYERDRLTP
jgi:phosphatidylserine/phosphatidylglycerophosphate/cardiolipin synthase-like enzyme